MIEDTTRNTGDVQVYEVGYHLLPSVPEEEVASEVAKIHSILSENGASVIAEGLPLLRQLAYAISKKIETKTLNFHKAYFGWIKFEMDRGQVENLKNKITDLPKILRFLIIKTVRENTMYSPKVPVFKKELSREDTATEGEVAAKTPATEAEIDKSIDDLVIN